MEKTIINPVILEWAINNAHLNIEDVAKKINVKEEYVLNWLSGNDSPTYRQLEKLSYSVLRIPIALFYFPEPPYENLTQSFRTLPDFIIDDLSPEFIRVLRNTTAMQLKLKELSVRLQS
jgi:transcriptional regulator with XRE-family HTH domain